LERGLGGVEVGQLLAGGCVPDTQLAGWGLEEIGARRSEELAVTREDGLADPVSTAREAAQLLAGRGVEEAERLVAARREEGLAVGGEVERGDAVAEPFQAAQLLAGARIPEDDELVAPAGGERPPVGRKGD